MFGLVGNRLVPESALSEQSVSVEQPVSIEQSVSVVEQPVSIKQSEIRCRTRKQGVESAEGNSCNTTRYSQEQESLHDCCLIQVLDV